MFALIWKSSSRNEGVGDLDTTVKGETSHAIVECRQCDKPNLFNCHLLHGYLPNKCQLICAARYEMELKMEME